MLSKETAILNMAVDHPTGIDSLKLDGGDLKVLKVKDSQFSNIMVDSGSILFNVDLKEIQ